MKRRILLADDELPILLTLKAVLEMHGFEVVTARSAREAIEKMGEQTFHLILTDMVMETENSGYDVIQAAREQTYEPAVSILTAHPVLGADWESSGAQSLLVKPVGTDELIRQIESVLTHHEETRRQRRVLVAATSSNPKPARNGMRKAG